MAENAQVSPKVSPKRPSERPAQRWFVVRCAVCWTQEIVCLEVVAHAPPVCVCPCRRCSLPAQEHFVFAEVVSLVPAPVVAARHKHVQAGEGLKLIQAGLPLLDLPEHPGHK